MKLEGNNEIKACLPKSRKLFYYYKDRYTFELLANSVEKPIVQDVVARYGDGLVCP
jgi:hypothetical protein